MKKLVILPVLVLLTACVQYYYPQTALEDGVYYAEDDPKYMVYQGSGPGAAYYPWSSLDYFYLGYNPYPMYPYYSGFPFGFLYGYSPWYYPYTRHGYYSPLYASYYRYPFFPVWRPYYGYCWNAGYCGHAAGIHADTDRDRFVGNHKGRWHNTDEDDSDEQVLAGNLDKLKAPGKGSSMSYNSYMLTMPPGYSGYGGMVVRSNESAKVGKTMIQPVRSGMREGNVSIRPGQSVTTLPVSASSSPAASAGSTAGPAYRQAPASPRPALMSAPNRASGASNRSRPSHSSPRSRPSKTGSSRPVRDLD